MKTNAIALTLILLSTPVYAKFIRTYSEWESLPDVPKRFYLGGLFDGLIDDNGASKETVIWFSFNQCLNNANMTLGQLPENLQAYVNTHPTLQRRQLRDALTSYLTNLCQNEK